MTFDELQVKLGPQDGSDWSIHPNGGGWVQKSCQVALRALVDDDSIVAGEARVLGDVTLINSIVKDKAKIGTISSNAISIVSSVISDNAVVLGRCVIRGSKIYEHAKVVRASAIDSSVIRGNAWISGSAFITNHCNIYDNARIYGRSYVGSRSTVCGNARVYGRGRVANDSWVDGNARISGNAEVSECKIGGYVRVYGDSSLDLVKANGKERYYEYAFFDF